jgi:hypothetical protein
MGINAYSYTAARKTHVLARLQPPYRLFEFMPALGALETDYMSVKRRSSRNAPRNIRQGRTPLPAVKA